MCLNVGRNYEAERVIRNFCCLVEGRGEGKERKGGGCGGCGGCGGVGEKLVREKVGLVFVKGGKGLGGDGSIGRGRGSVENLWSCVKTVGWVVV